MMKIITTSWDDGVKESLEVANLLNNYGLAGTFFVPVNAVKGGRIQELEFQGKFLSEEELRILSRDFEVGGHGVSHRYLTRMPKGEMEKEIRNSKNRLESLTGKDVHGFAYPGGKYNQQIVSTVKNLGFTYGRTTEDGSLEPTDRFKLSISAVCGGTFIGKLKFTLLSPFSNVYAVGGDWKKTIFKAYQNTKKLGGVLHIAGHPQDILKEGYKEKLESVFSKISGDSEVEYLTNYQTIKRLEEEGLLE